MKYLIFNLKSKLKYLDIIEYTNSISNLKKDIIIAPNYIYLEHFHNHGFSICSQDVSKYPIGNYTGEVSAESLKSIGCKYTLIGHYERRHYFNETKEDILDKTQQAINHNLKVIYCIGDQEQTEYSLEVLQKQIGDLLDNLDNKQLSNIIIAYEPVWLIGKNEKIDVAYITMIISTIKKFIFTKYSLEIDIIYGGSVNSSNIEDLKKLPVEGYLVGDSSTSVEEIFTLYNGLQQ